MGVLDNLEPKAVFHYFEEISRIPRPSHGEKAVSDYLVSFAKERNLEVYQDEIYNVIMIKEATPGYENEEPIILQGHMDMVCEKAPDVTKDMNTEGLDLEIRDNAIWAKGTTLGGDDGIAVAYALALLDSDTLKHPRLEFVCTVCEEVGMDGAHAVDCSPLKGHLLLNMDSEEEGIVLAGCAGGGESKVSLEVEREACDWPRMLVRIHGLMGGHSGAEIHKGRASSVTLMGRVLREAAKVTGLRLVSAVNGSKDNAISREGSMIAAVEDPKAFAAKIEELQTAISAEYVVADKNVRLECSMLMQGFGTEKADGIAMADPLTRQSTDQVIVLLAALPQGIQRMSDNVPGLVETSLNWGVAELDEEKFEMKAAVRSSVGTAYTELADRITCIAKGIGAKNEMSAEYPAWEWVQESVLRDKLAVIYREMFGSELKIEAIHAGVECGLLAGKIPNLDAVSMGPDIIDIHTPNEHLDIASTQRMWNFIVSIIETKN
ncbi:MAG: aminoacyl-histidine dipeptidase [Eubacteriales bacterium]|nr:aminoacyl-histidine dipeptidase [Eubacteriales bacterium]